MAKKHKAPTEVTLVQEEKSAFATWIEANWKMLAFAAIGVSALIIAGQLMGQKKKQSLHASLDSLREAFQSGDLDRLESVAPQLAAEGLDGWAYLQAAQVAVSQGRLDEAQDLVKKLESSAAPILKLEMPIGVDGASETLLDYLSNSIAGTRKQLEETGITLFNPPPPSGSPRVRINTSLGPIEVALYEEAAPKHVANFLGNVESGIYKGTRFHRIIRGFMIQGGNPATTDPDPTKWTEDDEAELIPSEADNGLVHSPFVLAAAKKDGDEDSSPYQFYITEGHAHWLDGEHTVFGRVVSGEEVVHAIAATPTDPKTGRPADAPVIESIEKL